MSEGAPPRHRLAVTTGWCVLLFSVAMVCRHAYLRYVGIESQDGGDMGEYIALARNLVEGHGFSSDGVTPATYRPPLFSWLLAAWCWLLGDTHIETMVAFQVVVQSLTAPLTYLLVRDLQASHHFAIVSGLFMSAYPYPISTVSLVLQEPTQTLFAAGVGLCLAWWWRAPSIPRAVAAGTLLGLCSLAKSPFLIGPPIVLLIGLGLRHVPRRPPYRLVWLVVAVSAAVVVPWTLRNAHVTGGRFMPINSQNVTILIWMVADGHFQPRESPTDPVHAIPAPERGVGFTYGNEDGVAYLRRQNETLLQQGLTGYAVVEGLSAAARSYLLRHPGYVLRLMFRGAILSFVPYAVGPIRGVLAARMAAMVLFHLPLALGLAASLVRAWREREAVIAMLSLLVMAYLLAHTTVSMEGGRYALPMFPLMLAVAGYSLFGAGGEPPAEG